MSESTDITAHEAYAFACMRCGHGWEQAYDIEHHVDASGRTFVVYKADGRRVPSPLSTPTCTNCGGHVVRIMRPGRVSSVRQLLAGGMGVTATGVRPVGERAAKPKPASVLAAASGTEPVTERIAGPAPKSGSGATLAAGAEPHHWHLSDLLHLFHRK
ncbi:hypothetical protein AB0M87_23910 [Streptomyces sp. NPDC051320]|uniref:hypothetical protein n=1 Tax=Streptomyces sp. NPDC051320 TaxID=3154644 RepID=UPI00341A4A5C